VAAYLGTAEDGARVLAVGPDLAPEHVAACWPPLGLTGPEAASGDEPADEVVALDPATFVAGRPTELTWARLESQLALTAADHLVHRVPVHAGLASWQGATVLLPGPSHAGKSTLVLAMSDLGATVLTDEYALLDPATGRASGWPRPIRRRRADGGIDLVALPRAARDALAEPVPVDLVAVLRFDRSHDGRPWRSVAAPEIVHELIGNTVNARRQPDRMLDAALAVGRSAAGISGRRGEATDAAALLLRHLEDLGTP
jgi:hypothetical protein